MIADTSAARTEEAGHHVLCADEQRHHEHNKNQRAEESVEVPPKISTPPATTIPITERANATGPVTLLRKEVSHVS
jgi:hypothetical protein